MGTKIVIFSVLFLVLGLSISCLAEDVTITDCGSESGSIIKVTLSGCENVKKCPLKKGSNATLTATFTSNVDSKTLKAVVYGRIGFIKSKFNLPNPNACESGVVCPLTPGQVNTYTVSILIKSSYPRVNVDIELHLRDDNGKDVVCALIPAQIVANTIAKQT